MANVYYKHSEKLGGYPWLKEVPPTFGVSSEMLSFMPGQLKDAGVKGYTTRHRIIEKEFNELKDWYTLNWTNPYWFGCYTRKIKDPMFRGPDGKAGS